MGRSAIGGPEFPFGLGKRPPSTSAIGGYGSRPCGRKWLTRTPRGDQLPRNSAVRAPPVAGDALQRFQAAASALSRLLLLLGLLLGRFLLRRGLLGVLLLAVGLLGLVRAGLLETVGLLVRLGLLLRFRLALLHVVLLLRRRGGRGGAGLGGRIADHAEGEGSTDEQRDHLPHGFSPPFPFECSMPNKKRLSCRHVRLESASAGCQVLSPQEVHLG